jgi:KaiC/GvpD/RAD55 family RecA-like ATPase
MVEMEGITTIQVIWAILYLSALSLAFTATLYTLFSSNYNLKAGANGLLFILFALCISTVSALLSALLRLYDYSSASDILLYIPAFLYISSWVGLFLVFLQAYGRIYHLKEKRFVKYMFPFRYITNKLRPGKTYELDMIPRECSPNLFKSIPFSFDIGDINIIKNGYSFLFIGNNKINISDLALQLLLDGINNRETANYICVDKHPSQVWEKAKKIKSDITESNKDIIFIDAYTPNYGFDDEILADRLEKIKADGVEVVKGKTIAGVHSATGAAFRIIKKYEKEEKRKETRRPHRMVYDSLSTLEDASSMEQIKIFFNHCIPAEKNYKMITFIVEYEESNKEILTTIKRLVDGIIEFEEKNNKLFLKITKLRDIDKNKYSGEKEWTPIVNTERGERN